MLTIRKRISALVPRTRREMRVDAWRVSRGGSSHHCSADSTGLGWRGICRLGPRDDHRPAPPQLLAAATRRGPRSGCGRLNFPPRSLPLDGTAQSGQVARPPLGFEPGAIAWPSAALCPRCDQQSLPPRPRGFGRVVVSQPDKLARGVGARRRFAAPSFDFPAQTIRVKCRAIISGQTRTRSPRAAPVAALRPRVRVSPRRTARGCSPHPPSPSAATTRAHRLGNV